MLLFHKLLNEFVLTNLLILSKYYHIRKVLEKYTENMKIKFNFACFIHVVAWIKHVKMFLSVIKEKSIKNAA